MHMEAPLSSLAREFNYTEVQVLTGMSNLTHFTPHLSYKGFGYISEIVKKESLIYF